MAFLVSRCFFYKIYLTIGADYDINVLHTGTVVITYSCIKKPDYRGIELEYLDIEIE